MSEWFEVKDKGNIDLSEDGKSVYILFETNQFGNRYVEIPIEFFNFGFPAELGLKDEQLVDLREEIAAKDAEIARLKAAIKKVMDGNWCDNDGRGCGASNQVAFAIGVCPDCTWRNGNDEVELNDGVCPICGEDWNFFKEMQ